VAESTCLESTRPGNGTVGSNPTLSATEHNAELKTWAVVIYLSTRKGAGPCAISSCEPRQVRKEATVSRSVCVPQDHLAPLFIAMLKQVPSFVLASEKSSTYPSGYVFGFLSAAASFGRGASWRVGGWV
jgi:hypothetical protein